MICVNFYQTFFHGIQYRRTPRYSIPWKKFRSKLTQIIGQTLFFHFDGMKTIPWKIRHLANFLNYNPESLRYPDK